MIYAKDIILGDLKKEKGQVFNTIINKIKNNKIMTLTVSLCTLLIGFDFILIYGFIRLLGTL